ncbi:nucleotidyl transferase AbiEii/AbiGii toxin family protein [Hymenobacter nivis]|uniref:Nucleotidyl transferase AbiEii/AbiGii toxin family protein n=1 Tax=Hymenobacter nivis TaxID=1850093 RepID=A0A502GBK0_9BACT|nr:nucleotidyl transferase AbiEii/AbiGii toxin family protein [Hymenobacter nivis]TPG59459.1 nucleotidyl transferase AbiEii/AbiGii toxin family protein [Hymenobacter nivis]
MTLHLHPTDFRALLAATAQQLGMADVLIEKDYWVTYILRALADSPYRDQVVFKGGTALSKAYGLSERFSEDVDLAIAGTEGWSNNQVKKLMDSAARHLTQGLAADPTAPGTSRGSHFRKTAHQFPALLAGGATWDSQLRTGAVLLEINAFARPYPSHRRAIQSYLGQFLAQQGQTEAMVEFGLAPFEVLTLALERTLTEKILALVRAGAAPDPLRELEAKIRHAYDVHQILQQPAVAAFFASPAFAHLLQEVQADDARNQEFQGDWATQPLTQAQLFADGGRTWARLIPTYLDGFRKLVYGVLPPAGAVGQTLALVGTRLQALAM